MGCRIFQPRNYQPKDSTPNFSTMNEKLLFSLWLTVEKLMKRGGGTGHSKVTERGAKSAPLKK